MNGFVAAFIGAGAAALVDGIFFSIRRRRGNLTELELVVWAILTPTNMFGILGVLSFQAMR